MLRIQIRHGVNGLQLYTVDIKNSQEYYKDVVGILRIT